MSETLCWQCDRVYYRRGCPWADDFKPVDGWNAKKQIKKNSGRKIVSYNVESCPLFIKTERKRGNKK